MTRVEDIYKLVELQCKLLNVSFELDSEDNPDTLGFFDSGRRRLVLRTSYLHPKARKWKKVSRESQILTAFHELRHVMQQVEDPESWIAGIEMSSGEIVNHTDIFDEFEAGERFHTLTNRRVGAQVSIGREADADTYAFQMMHLYNIKYNREKQLWFSNRILYATYLCAETGINLASSQMRRLVPRDMQDHIGIDPVQAERMLREIEDNPAYYRRYSLGYWKTPTQYISNRKQ